MHLSEKADNADYIVEMCLDLDATPNTLQCECIHVTFRSNDQKFVLLQLTHSVCFKTLCV